MTPDVNVIISGARPDHPHHAQAREWWMAALASASTKQPIYLLPVVVSGFLRIVTHPKIFLHPSTIDEATAHIDALLALPHVTLQATQPEWSEFKRLCVEKALAGNAIPDAWIAATIIAASGHLVTFDRDFRKLLKRSQVTVVAL